MICVVVSSYQILLHINVSFTMFSVKILINFVFFCSMQSAMSQPLVLFQSMESFCNDKENLSRKKTISSNFQRPFAMIYEMFFPLHKIGHDHHPFEDVTHLMVSVIQLCL